MRSLDEAEKNALSEALGELDDILRCIGQGDELNREEVLQALGRLREIVGYLANGVIH